MGRHNFQFYDRKELRMNFDKLDKLAILYNTSVDYLLYRTDINYPYPERQKVQD